MKKSMKKLLTSLFSGAICLAALVLAAPQFTVAANAATIEEQMISSQITAYERYQEALKSLEVREEATRQEIEGAYITLKEIQDKAEKEAPASVMNEVISAKTTAYARYQHALTASHTREAALAGEIEGAYKTLHEMQLNAEKQYAANQAALAAEAAAAAATREATIKAETESAAITMAALRADAEVRIAANKAALEAEAAAAASTRAALIKAETESAAITMAALQADAELKAAANQAALLAETTAAATHRESVIKAEMASAEITMAELQADAAARIAANQAALQAEAAAAAAYFASLK